MRPPLFLGAIFVKRATTLSLQGSRLTSAALQLDARVVHAAALERRQEVLCAPDRVVPVAKHAAAVLALLQTVCMC